MSEAVTLVFVDIGVLDLASTVVKLILLMFMRIYLKQASKTHRINTSIVMYLFTTIHYFVLTPVLKPLKFLALIVSYSLP